MRELRARMREFRVSVQKLRIGMQKPRIGMQKPRADMQKLRVERYKEDLASVIDSLENKSLPTSSTEIPFFQTFGSVQATPSSCPKCSLDVSHHPVGQHSTSKTFLALPDMLPHRTLVKCTEQCGSFMKPFSNVISLWEPPTRKRSFFST
jgi:hypothetical protein